MGLPSMYLSWYGWIGKVGCLGVRCEPVTDQSYRPSPDWAGERVYVLTKQHRLIFRT